MRRLLLSFLLFSALAFPLAAQNFTAVTATVVDPNGVPYVNGRLTFTLTNSAGGSTFAASPTLGGAIFNTVFNASLNSNGVLSVIVPSNAVILPTGTLWVVQVCPVAAWPCASTVPLTISGASQDISAYLNSVVLAQATGQLVPFPGQIGAQTTLNSSSSVTPAVNIVAAAPQTQLYRVRYYIFQSVAGVGCSVSAQVTVTIGWTDPGGGGTAQTITSSAVAMGNSVTSGTEQQAQISVVAQQGTAITYATSWTNGTCSTSQPKYSVYVDAAR